MTSQPVVRHLRDGERVCMCICEICYMAIYLSVLLFAMFISSIFSACSYKLESVLCTFVEIHALSYEVSHVRFYYFR